MMLAPMGKTANECYAVGRAHRLHRRHQPCAVILFIKKKPDTNFKTDKLQITIEQIPTLRQNKLIN